MTLIWSSTSAHAAFGGTAVFAASIQLETAHSKYPEQNSKPPPGTVKQSSLVTSGKRSSSLRFARSILKFA